jgi:hypothetical protein
MIEKFKWILSNDLQTITKYLHLPFDFFYECSFSMLFFYFYETSDNIEIAFFRWRGSI